MNPCTYHARPVEADEGNAQAGDLCHVHVKHLRDALLRQVDKGGLDGVGEVAQHVGADEVEHDSSHRKQQCDDDGSDKGLNEEEEFAHCLFEVFGLFRDARPAHGAVAARRA